MTTFLLIQIIGFIAVIFSVLTYRLNKRKNMLITETIAAFLYSLYFFLLGATTGGAMNFIGGLRAIAYFKYPPSKDNRWVLWLFIIFAVVATYFFWDGVISLLALIGTLGYAFAYWQKNPKIIRRFMLITFPTWFTYNLIVGSYPGMAIKIIVLISNLTGQYRFDYRKSSK
jgi:hypothetical protein